VGDNTAKQIILCEDAEFARRINSDDCIRWQEVRPIRIVKGGVELSAEAAALERGDSLGDPDVSNPFVRRAKARAGWRMNDNCPLAGRFARHTNSPSLSFTKSPLASSLQVSQAAPRRVLQSWNAIETSAFRDISMTAWEMAGKRPRGGGAATIGAIRSLRACPRH
jgi:hypothetical protein